jgi:hypothetical protein
MFVLFVCLYRTAISINLVPTPEIHLQIYGTPKNACAIYFTITTKLIVNKMPAYNIRSHVKQRTLLGIHSSHLFHEWKIDLGFPQQYMTETVVITYRQFTAQVTKLTTTITKHAKRRSILLKLFISLSIATKTLNSPQYNGHGLPT